MARLVVIDNYDSFTYNLVQMFLHYDLEIDVYRNDRVSVQKVGEINPDYILISPGPKDPENAGISIQLIRELCGRVPILGVCLGMQCINEAFGGDTVKAPVPVHGKTSKIRHNNRFIFQGLPSPFSAARYHSLSVKSYNKSLVVTANSIDGVIMGISHPQYPLHGVQFHPESFLTEYGDMIVQNFLKTGTLKEGLNKNS